MPPPPRRFSRADPARWQNQIERGMNVRMRATREREFGRSLIQVSLNMDEMGEYQRTLALYGRRAAGIVNRRAVRAGMRPIRMTMRRLAPVHKTYSKRTGRQLKRTRTSALKRSIGTNGPWTYRNTGITVGVVGPRNIKNRLKNPARYAHLVEMGHNILERPWASRKGAPIWRKIRARPFVQPALKQNASRSIAEMNRVYRAELFKLTGYRRYRPAA